MQRPFGIRDTVQAVHAVGPAVAHARRAPWAAQDDQDEPEWARGLGLTEKNVRDAFAEVGVLFRNMAVAQAPGTTTVAVCERRRGRVTVSSGEGTYSASYVVSGSTLTVRSAGAQRTLTLAKVTASIEKVVKQVLSAMIAQGQPVLRSTR